MNIHKNVGRIPIYIAYEESVRKYAELCGSCIRYVLSEGLDVSQFFPVKLIGDNWFDGSYGSVAWYLYNCEKEVGSYGLQYRASDLLELFKFDILQWSDPHIKILITEKSLYERDVDGRVFCVHSMVKRLVSRSFKKFKVKEQIGVNVPGIVFSVCGIEKYYKQMAKAAFIILSIREIARLFGVLERANEVKREYEKRCIKDDCVMGVGKYIREKKEIENISKRSEETDSFFCETCKNELIERKKHWVRSLFEVNL